MPPTLHITNGDTAGSLFSKSGIPGEVLVWRDVLYDGPRKPGWPDEKALRIRAAFLSDDTGGALNPETVFETLNAQYRRLASAAEENVWTILWFDACLFDLSMLAHILFCLFLRKAKKVELLCVDAFPGIVPFNGLGQLSPAQLASVYGQRRPVTEAQFQFAGTVDTAFANQDLKQLQALSQMKDAPLPRVPAAANRWLEEQPDPATGLGRLETLALAAIRAGAETPGDIFNRVSAADTPPQYWGDTTLWAKINGLADKTPPQVKIEGPADRLPQWESSYDLDQFRIKSLP